MRVRVLPRADALNPLQSLVTRRWHPGWVCQSCKSRTRPWRVLSTSVRISEDALNSQEKPYYVTTPIFYVNAAPHVGHMYTMVLSDVLKRWQQLKGRRAVLMTGTDEHGMKIQQAAAKAGVEPKEFCDKGAEIFKQLAESMGMSNDIFIRTTDRKHKDAVEYAWHILQERGYIYESKHEGWYSVSDETFYPQSQVQLIVDPPTGRKIMSSIETGKEVEWTSERNYHFRLSAFRDRLLEFYAQNPDFIVPKTRMADVVQQVTAGLEDLSVSRPAERLNWGVPVPTDPSQTIYVWLDALLNYATAAGYPFTPGLEAQGGWPPDVQVVGKDIVRFHCIYWPAFLMALDLPITKQVLTHAHWTLGKLKMAKSTGNVVNPFFALERFGTDPMRWYLIQEGGITDDADYDNIFIIEKYKKGLQGGLGNLASRVMRSRNWDVARAVRRYAYPTSASATPHPPTSRPARSSPQASPATADAADDNDLPAIHTESSVPTRRFHGQLRALPAAVDAHMRDLHPNRALRTIMNAIYSANGYITSAAPWTQAKELKRERPTQRGDDAKEEDAGREAAAATAAAGAGEEAERMQAALDRTIYLNAEALRLCGIMLQPFIPGSARRLLDMLGVREERRTWEWCRAGADETYGEPMVDLGLRGGEGTLFPGLSSDS